MDAIRDSINVSSKDMKKFAIELLDDENGIKQEAYELLQPMLGLAGGETIMRAVDGCDNRVYIGEDAAEVFKKELED